MNCTSKTVRKMQQEVRNLLAEVANKDLREQIEKFNNFLNNCDPSEENLRQVPIGKDSKGNNVHAQYVPIEIHQNFLDMIFGEWHEENARWERVMNEVAFTMDLVVLSPITNRLIRRTGAGAAPIQQKKLPDENQPGKMRSARLDEFQETKQMNALQSALPAAKAFAFTNACKSLGKQFGRDLNREQQPTFHSIYSIAKKSEEEEARAIRYIEEHSPEELVNVFGNDFLQKYPKVESKLNEKLFENETSNSSERGGKTDDPTQDEGS